jgi:hypothetical protein
VVVRKLDLVPGIAGAYYSDILQGAPSMTSTGRVAFKARFKRPRAPRNRVGIFIEE